MLQDSFQSISSMGKNETKNSRTNKTIDFRWKGVIYNVLTTNDG